MVEREREWHVSFLGRARFRVSDSSPRAIKSTMVITVNRNLLQNRTVISVGLQKSAV